MGTNKQPPPGLSIDDAIAEELDSSAGFSHETPLETQKLEQLPDTQSEGDDPMWDMGSETRVMAMPDAGKIETTVNKQMARLQPLPPGVSAEIDFGERRFTLKKSLTIIGRVKEVADVAFTEDDQMSRHHAAVGYADGDFFIEDLESTNGTFMDGRRIKRAPLKPGIEVTVGRHKFKLVTR
jgi:pSer/pThr/pTyr-binding forkhead associated (FHA) protein